MSESKLKKTKIKRKLIIESSSSKSNSSSKPKSSSSSPLLSSKSVEMKLKSEPEDSEFDEEQENPEILNDEFRKIKNLLEMRIEKSKHLENTLPSKYMEYDASCSRKYSNFSFPKDYKFFYDFVDYFPSKKVCEEKEIENNDDLKEYLHKLHNKYMYHDFINTLKLVSPKILTLLNKIQELDDKDMAQYGKKFKHFIFSDYEK